MAIFTRPVSLILRLLRDRAGATAIEYALIAAIMTALVVTALALLDLEDVFSRIQNTLDSA